VLDILKDYHEELIEKIKSKLTDGKILPKSNLQEAMGYFCGLIPYLKNYTKGVLARLDNNVAERAFRALAIGGFSLVVLTGAKQVYFTFSCTNLPRVRHQPPAITSKT